MNDVQAKNFEAFNIMVAALQQIERLSKDADRTKVDVATMLGEIATKALSKL